MPFRPGITTPNVIKAKSRKAENRRLRDEADRSRAAELGISVEELLSRRAHEVASIISNPNISAQMREAAEQASWENYRRFW